MPSRERKTLTHSDRDFPREVRSHFDSPTAYAGVSAGAEALNVRRITVQVRDRLEQPWAGRFLVRVWLTATSGGDPNSTGNTVALITGTAIQTVTADASYLFLTDANGRVVFDVEITGAATRYVATSVDMGLVDYSEAIAWI